MASQHPVLSQLQAANDEWRNAVTQVSPDFFQNSTKGQTPKALWIGCADSRVPESVVLAAKPGDLFVHRNIANQFHPNDDSALSVLTYAIEPLGVKHVIVAGHTQCGGCVGAWNHCANPPANVPDAPLVRWLTPLIKLADSLGLGSKPQAEAVDVLVRASVKKQVENVVQTDIIQRAWAENKDVRVHGWVYELETGKLKDLGITHKAPWAT